MQTRTRFRWKNNHRPMKPVMKTGRSEVKPPISLSSVLDFSSRSEEEGEDGWGKESEDEAVVECLYCAGFVL